MAWPPFLNCACATPPEAPSVSTSPAQHPKNLRITHLRFDLEQGPPTHYCRHRRIGRRIRKHPNPATHLEYLRSRLTSGPSLLNISIRTEVCSELRLESLHVVQMLYIVVKNKIL